MVQFLCDEEARLEETSEVEPQTDLTFLQSQQNLTCLQRVLKFKDSSEICSIAPNETFRTILGLWVFANASL